MRDQIVQSQFFITINSNIPAKGDQEKINSFLQTVRTVFLSSHILNFLKVTDEDDKDTEKTKLISSIDMDTEIENEGKKQNRVHTHITVKVMHYTTLLLNVEKLNTYFMQRTNRVVYIDVRVTSGGAQDVSLARYKAKSRKSKRPLIITGIYVDLAGKIRRYSNL
jgi:hypothetical protein